MIIANGLMCMQKSVSSFITLKFSIMDAMGKPQSKYFKFIFLPAFTLVGLGVLIAMVQHTIAPLPSKTTETPLSQIAGSNNKTIIKSAESMGPVNRVDLESNPPEPSPHGEPQQQLNNFAVKGIANGGMASAFAVIENMNDQIQKLYRVGDTIGKGVVSRILNGKVVIRLSGIDEVLTMVKGSFSEKRKKEMPPVVTLDGAELKDMLRDKNRLLSQVKIRPVKSPDGISGLLASAIEPGSLMEQIGFQNGDIIQEINGAAIRSPYKLTAIYEGLKLIPFNLLPQDDLGLKIGSILEKVDGQAGGVTKEVSAVYGKIKSGKNVPVRFWRNGKRQLVTIRCDQWKSYPAS
jgi:type II secretion system protein C